MALSVHDARHHARTLGRGGGEDGSGVAVGALLLVPQLVVVRPEAAATEAARVGLLA